MLDFFKAFMTHDPARARIPHLLPPQPTCLVLQNETAEGVRGAPVEEARLASWGKALDKPKSTTQLRGGIVIPRSLFVVGFPQMFSKDQTRLIFPMVPLEAGFPPSSTFAARAQRVFGMTFRDSFGGTGEMWSL